MHRAGPSDVELAQAYARLGAAVTLVGGSLLPGDEPEAGAVLERVLKSEGVRRVLGRAESVAAAAGGAHRLVCSEANGARVEVEGDALLVATGRKPVVAGLNLKAAQIEIESLR